MRTSILLATLASIPSLLALRAPSLYPRTYTDISANASYCPGHPAPEYIQRQIFDGFVNQLYGEKDVIGAFNKYIALNLTEHDPFDAQGRIANEEKLSYIIPYVPSIVLRHSFDNNIGFIHVRVNEANEEPIALADIYRMDGTCLVEHWDVTQSRPANATNPIAMF
ncbi:hypothetical protein HO133_006414 [Letharia lupina]|uniref:SnoaL-like domain-containing protein n=1 Tax=Letharia lupina TaxID=560253 RepID=A0A8H6F7D2_9LECA|nr:uncharacterized protein HO133_006414 [Letharia lupina]KAF6218002.1 hypothetical protein HO133_006414 [Letharia lupina]